MDTEQSKQEVRPEANTEKTREFKKVSDKADDKFKKESRFLNYASLMAALTGAIIYLIFFTTNSSKKDRIDTLIYDSLLVSQRKTITTLLERDSMVKFEIANLLAKQVENLKGVSIKSIEYLNTKREIDEMKDQLQRLSNVILETPEKAVSIPMLRLEIENMKNQREAESKAIKDEVARVYDINKWIVGLVFSMLVSIIILNISNLISKRKKD